MCPSVHRDRILCRRSAALFEAGEWATSCRLQPCLKLEGSTLSNFGTLTASIRSRFKEAANLLRIAWTLVKTDASLLKASLISCSSEQPSLHSQ